MVDKQARSAAPLKGKHESFGGTKRDQRDHFDAGFDADDDLAWFILAGGAAMGEKGTLAGVVNMLEHGGIQAGGVPNTHLYSDQQVGLGPNLVGLVEKHRYLSEAWSHLDQRTRAVLAACYVAVPAKYRTDQGFGARDVCPPVEAIQRGHLEPSRGRHRESRTGVEAHLGQLAALCFLLIGGDELEAQKECGRLLQACQQPGKGQNGRTIRRALRQARAAAREAHKVWAGYKVLARKPRKVCERRAVLPAHMPHRGGDL